MFCEKCGTAIIEDENFCGSCGTRIINSDDRYEVFNYSVRQAKENKCYMSFSKMIWYSVLLSIPIVLGALLVGFLVEDGATSVIIGMSFCAVMMAIIIAAAVQMAAYLRAPSWAIVLDKHSNTYYVVQQPTQTSGGWDTASRVAAMATQAAEMNELSKRAQIDTLMIKVVKNYQDGLMKRSALQKLFVTPEFIVIPLQSPKIISKKQKSNIISYQKENGGRKKIKIANAYPGFEIGKKNN